MISLISTLKGKVFFSENEWETRGLEISPQETVSEMRRQILSFLEFLEEFGDSDVYHESWVAEIQEYIDHWESNDLIFDTEEREWMIDEFFEILRNLGIEGVK